MSISPLAIISALLLLASLGLGLADPIPQNPAYHDYGDQRVILGIPYFWNVVSNLPMLFIGSYGLWQCARNWSHRPAGVARLIPLVLSFGIFITCFGSYSNRAGSEAMTGSHRLTCSSTQPNGNMSPKI